MHIPKTVSWACGTRQFMVVKQSSLVKYAATFILAPGTSHYGATQGQAPASHPTHVPPSPCHWQHVRFIGQRFSAASRFRHWGVGSRGQHEAIYAREQARRYASQIKGWVA